MIINNNLRNVFKKDFHGLTAELVQFQLTVVLDVCVHT